MTLMPNEKELPLGINGLTVTTHRARLNVGSGSNLVVSSIMLEHVTHLNVGKQALGLLLIIALVLGGFSVLALFSGDAGVGAGILGMVIALIFLAGYLASKATTLRITSADGGSIYIRTKHLPEEQMIYLIDRIEEAIDARRTAVDAVPPKTSRPLVERQESPRRSALPATAQECSYQISRNGQDQGVLAISTIKKLLKVGQLSLEDYYLDTAANEWMPLDHLPELA